MKMLQKNNIFYNKLYNIEKNLIFRYYIFLKNKIMSKNVDFLKSLLYNSKVIKKYGENKWLNKKEN